MNMKAASWLMATTLLWWTPAGHAETQGCLIEPDRVADVGTEAVGVLSHVKVERGDTVAAGQLIARLSAQVERATAGVAQARANAEAEYQQALANSALSQRKLTRTRDLVKQNFVSGQALDQAEAEARIAEQRVLQTKEVQQVSQREYQLSTAQLAQREVRSPFGGIVLERYRTEGERVEREPVVRVARVDPLRVEALVPAKLFSTIKAGQLAVVKTDLTLFPSLSAKVVLVDRVIDPASNSFRVRLSLPNPSQRIPAGLRCRLSFVDPADADKPSATPPPTPSATPSATPPTATPAMKERLSSAAQRLPGARLSATAAPERQAVKHYLQWRKASLSMSKGLAMPGATLPESMGLGQPGPPRAYTVALR